MKETRSMETESISTFAAGLAFSRLHLSTSPSSFAVLLRNAHFLMSPTATQRVRVFPEPLFGRIRCYAAHFRESILAHSRWRDGTLQPSPRARTPGVSLLRIACTLKNISDTTVRTPDGSYFPSERRDTKTRICQPALPPCLT